VKIPAKSLEIRAKFVDIWAKCVKTFANPLCFDFTKIGPKIKMQTVFFGGMFLFSSSGKLGEIWPTLGEFGQKWCLKCFDLKKRA